MTDRTNATLDPRLTYVSRVVHGLTWLGGAAMVIMVAIIIVSVVMRYLLGQPMLGSNELIQMTSVVLVMTALPYCTAEEAHIRVDIFDYVLGRWGCFAGDIFFRVLSGFVLGVLTYRSTLKALDTFRWSDTTNMLNLPVWPMYALLALGTALTVVVFIAQIIEISIGVRRR